MLTPLAYTSAHEVNHRHVPRVGQARRPKAVQGNDRETPQGDCPQSGTCALVEKEKTMSKERLPRGIRRRGDSLVVSFALADGSIERRSVGDVSISYAVEQLGIYKRQVREGCYVPKKPRVKETVYTVGDFWTEYLRAYKLSGRRGGWRQKTAWAHLKPT